MEYNSNEIYLIEYLLPKLGRDILTESYKTFDICQEVTASELFRFAEVQSLIFQLEQTTLKTSNGVLKRIHILDNKDRTHILALEIK